MHELSIAVSLIELAEEEAQRRRGVRIAAIHLRLGPLSGVATEALESSFDLAKADSLVSDAKLLIERTPLEAYCPTCSAVRELASPQQLVCPVCSSPTPQIVRGRELQVVALEIES